MATLYVDRKGIELRYAGGVIEVHEPSGKRGTIPLVGLERVVLRGRVQLSTSVIGALMKAGASVAMLGGRQSHYLATCVGSPHNDVLRRLGQFDAFRDGAARVRWARDLVEAKIVAQQRLLRKAMAVRPELRRPLLRGAKRLDEALERLSASERTLTLPTLLGIEGAAAASYFSAYATLLPPSLGFRVRRRRPPPDPVNACLSLGYTLLHYDAVAISHAAGLDPMLGLYHEPAYGRESFAADAIEPFRPHVDEWVWDLFRRRVFTARNFRRDGHAVTLSKGTRSRFYRDFHPLGEALRRLLRRQVQHAAREFQHNAKGRMADVGGKDCLPPTSRGGSPREA